MSVAITYFVHGTTTDNEQKISSGWFDVELSALGREQGKQLIELTKDKVFDVVFCSDLKRSIDSANITWGGKYEIVVDARLREANYGDYNAQPSAIVESLQEQAITEPLPNGESYEEVKERIADFLSFVKENYDGKRVAITAHKAPQLALEVLLNGKTWEQAFAEDWRKTKSHHTGASSFLTRFAPNKRKSWQPGWEYLLP